jgi:glycosyltransferase involved in cell wall biosynthesis
MGSPELTTATARQRMNRIPRVIVSVWGRFWAFELAHELQERKALSRLITSYPRYAAERFGVNRANVVSCVLPEAAVRLARRFKSPWLTGRADMLARRWYERAARRALRREEGDIFVGWSGTSLSLIRDARRRGMITVVERGSSHIVEQATILREEHARYGHDVEEIPRAVIDQELAEYAEADYVAVPSRFVYESFLRQGFSPDRLLLNAFGANLAMFRPDRVPHEPFRIIQVGGVSIRKGFPGVVEAFRKAAIPNSELWFVGSITPEAETYFAKNQFPNVHLKGKVPQSALQGYYAQSDVMCLGSVEEGLALVLVQAAACGLPIVCTTNTGGMEIVGDNECGIVVPIRSPDAMADAFRALYEDRPRARAMGDAARRRAEEYFSWTAYGDRALKQYKRMCETRGLT